MAPPVPRAPVTAARNVIDRRFAAAQNTCSGEDGRWGMATIDESRAQLVAGQAERLRNDARQAEELLRRGKIDEARELVARNVQYANAIWHELDLLTRPPREVPIRGKSRNR